MTTSSDLVMPFMLTKYRHIENSSMRVISTICRARKLGCDSQTNQRYEMPAPVVVYTDFESAIDDKNRHKPIMLSCLAVLRIPAIQTQLRVFHSPHENEEDLRPFMEYLVQLHERVKEYLFDELPLENTSKVEKDFRSTTVCPFCHVELEDDKVRHHAHLAGEYTTGKGGICNFKAGQYICTCCTKYNL